MPACRSLRDTRAVLDAQRVARRGQVRSAQRLCAAETVRRAREGVRVNDQTLEAIACARANLANGCLVPGEEVVRDLADELDRLTFALHQRRAHPDFEYTTTQTARKSGSDPRLGLEGDGWEPNDV